MKEGRGQNPHQHSTFSFLCFNIFAGFFVCLRILTQQQNYTEIIISQKIIQCQKFQNLFWIMVQIPNWVRYPKEKNYSMPKVEDSSMASNSFSNKISGEG